MTCNQANLVKVDTDLPDSQLALIGSGVTTGVVLPRSTPPASCPC